MPRPEPHSRDPYALQAKERGGYFHPWRRSLDGPGAARASFLHVGPALQVPRRVSEIGWPPEPGLWSTAATRRGLPYFQERSAVLAVAG